MTLRTKHSKPSPRPKLLEVRPLTREDLSLLDTGYQIKRNRVQTFRDSHHRVARLIAAGFRPAEVAEATGYSLGTVAHFKKDPAFQELMASYRPDAIEVIRDATAEYEGLLIANRAKAERKIADRLDDEDDDRITTRDLITIARDAADRTGVGKRTTNVNINIGLARDLEDAQARRARAKTIDNVPSSPAALSMPAYSPPQVAPISSPRINRRGF